MFSNLDLRPAAYILIGVGCLLAFVTSIVPHYNAGYRLLFGVLTVGIAPYLIYGVLTEYLRGWALILPGAFLVAVHLWLAISQRLENYDGYTSGAIYYVPLILAAILAPLGMTLKRAFHEGNAESEESSKRPAPETDA